MYNKKLRVMKTIAQQLNIKTFPFEIKDSKGNLIYFEKSNGFWVKYEYDAQGEEIYYENSDNFWVKREFDSQGRVICHKNSDNFWAKYEYDSKGNQIYYENSDGEITDKRIKILTMDEIATKFNIPVSQLKIKK